MISAGNNQSTNNGQNSNGGGANSYAPKVGVFKAAIVAINPTIEELKALLKKDIKNVPEYTGFTNEGEKKINMHIWLQDMASGEFFRLNFIMVDKIRESKNNPGTFQLVNTAGQTVYAKDYADVNSRETQMYQEFRQRSFRFAFVGEENLIEFLSTWVFQGKKAKEGEIIDVDMRRLFGGDFSELKDEVTSRLQRVDKSTITAMATIAEKEGKTYQNVYRRVIPGWLMQKVLDGETTGIVGKWITEIKGPYGPRDQWSLAPLHQSTGGEQGQASASSESGYNHYGAEPAKLGEIPGAAEYQQRSSDGLPF